MDLLFWVGLSFLFSHELDAVEQNEWHFLPLLVDLPEGEAFTTFVALHVPLFAAIMWLASQGRSAVRTATQLSVDAFMGIHLGIHTMISGHPGYTFQSALSHTLIVGAAAIGLAHLALTLVMRRR